MRDCRSTVLHAHLPGIKVQFCCNEDFPGDRINSKATGSIKLSYDTVSRGDVGCGGTYVRTYDHTYVATTAHHG